MFGLTQVLFATTIVWTARVPRPIGYLMGLSGLAWIVRSWLVGTEGFTLTTPVPALTGVVSRFAWLIWLLIVAWRMKETTGAVSPPTTPAS